MAARDLRLHSDDDPTTTTGNSATTGIDGATKRSSGTSSHDGEQVEEPIAILGLEGKVERARTARKARATRALARPKATRAKTRKSMARLASSRRRARVRTRAARTAGN